MSRRFGFVLLAVTVGVLALPVASDGSSAAGASAGQSAWSLAVRQARPRPCRARDLSATYTLVPFSQGAGSESYLLTVRNRSRNSCTLSAPLGMRLLDGHRRPLPTNARMGRYRMALAAGQWAQAQARLSEDIAGPGEPPSRCEPAAHWLALRIGSGRVLAPMDPTPVCQRGAMYFDRLRPVARTPACAPALLSASVRRLSPPFRGRVGYRLALRNRGGACHMHSIAGLRLLSATGLRLPTRVIAGIPAPYVIGAHGHAVALATLYTAAGRGEPRHGPCEPLASRILITPAPGAGTLAAAIVPPLRACHHGTILLSGLIGCCLRGASSALRTLTVHWSGAGWTVVRSPSPYAAENVPGGSR